MNLIEKVRRIEEVVRVNTLYIREIWVTMKRMVRAMETNANGIKRITQSLMNTLNIDLTENDKKQIRPMTDDIKRLYK